METSIMNVQNYSKVEVKEARILSICLLFSTLNGAFRFLTSQYMGSAAIGSYFVLGVWGAILANYCLSNWGKAAKQMIAYCVLYALFLVVMYLLFPNTRSHFWECWDDLVRFIVVGFPGVVFLKRARNFDLVFRQMLPFIRVITILICTVYLMGGVEYFGYMEWGNRILPVVLMYSLCMKVSQAGIDKVLFFVAICFSMLGGRQAFVIVTLALVFLFFFREQNSRKKIIKIIFSVLLILLVVLFWDTIMELLDGFLVKNGIKSRALSKLIKGGLLEDNNRDYLYWQCREIIRENGMKISGVFADRYYLSHWSYGKVFGYAHNFVYELILDFGIVLGGLIVVFIFYSVLRSFIKCKSSYRYLLIVFILFGIVRILVSSSIFVYSNFLLLCGVLCNKVLYKNVKE